jgi:hypothetical protein
MHDPEIAECPRPAGMLARPYGADAQPLMLIVTPERDIADADIERFIANTVLSERIWFGHAA